MLQFSLEALACGLARKRANERTKRSICGAIGLCGIPCLRERATAGRVPFVVVVFRP